MKLLVTPLHSNINTIFTYARVKRIWSTYENDVIKALEETSGLRFESGVKVKVKVDLNDNPSLWSGSARHNRRLAIRIYMPSASFFTF